MSREYPVYYVSFLKVFRFFFTFIFGKCVMCTWKCCIFCRVLDKLFSKCQLDQGDWYDCLNLLCISWFFLCKHSIYCWKKDAKISYCDCGIVSFLFLLFFQFILPSYWWFVVRYIHMHGYYVIWWIVCIYGYKMSIFIIGNTLS